MARDGVYPSIAAIGKDVASVAAGRIDRTFRYVLRGPKVVAERRFVRLLTGEPHPFGNVAIVSDPADLEGTEAAIEPLLHCGAPAAVLFPGPVAGAVVDRLKETGFESHEPMPAMVVDIDSLSRTALPSGQSFARVGRGPEGEEWADVFSVGYEIPRGVGEVFSPNVVCATTAAGAAIQYFAVRKGGRMVCTSLVYLADGVAGIYCVATIPEERGKGLGAHATAEPLRLVRELGYGVGVLQSSAVGHALYRKLGFADVGEVLLYVKMPA